MIPVRIVLFLAGALALSTTVHAGGEPTDGTWKLSYFVSPSAEVTNWIIKLDTKDGKVTGSIVAGGERARNTSISEASASGRRVKLVFKVGAAQQIFEGSLADTNDRIVGVWDDDRRVYMAQLVRTDDTELDPDSATATRAVPAPMQQATELTNKFNQLLSHAQSVQRFDEKIKLLHQAVDLAQRNRIELPKLYREVVSNHADDIAMFDAALNLLRGASEASASADQVRQWAATVAKAAERFGPAWQREINTQIAQALALQKDYGTVALDHAELAMRQVQDSEPPSRQQKVLKVLAAIQQRLGRTDAFRETNSRIEKLDELLDREYFAKVRPLKAEPYPGRKTPGDRAVVMELFTGAECLPCIAADVAFDALAKTYKPTELILLQYHVHIPRGDPLTNPDTVARMGYYEKHFPQGVRGTPSTLFNGNPKAGGGGALGDAPGKLKEYREVIDKLLEQPAGAVIKAAAAAASPDRLDIKVDVTDASSSPEQLRLCVVVVEENVRYVGGNKLRFHHHVVRAMPTGPEGVPLPARGKPYSATIDLNDLRAKWRNYLDDYAATGSRPLTAVDRPLDFKNLRVVAFVQNEKSKEIVQGVSVDLAGQSAKK
jgi:hypothetical protein